MLKSLLNSSFLCRFVPFLCSTIGLSWMGYPICPSNLWSLIPRRYLKFALGVLYLRCRLFLHRVRNVRRLRLRKKLKHGGPQTVFSLETTSEPHFL